MVADEAQRWARQVRKGSTKLAILQLVAEKDRYGYELVTEVKARTRGRLLIAEGNLYPALHALEKEGYVASYWEEVEPGVPPRKYYTLTRHGKRLHARLVEAWHEFGETMAWLLEGGKDSEIDA